MELFCKNLIFLDIFWIWGFGGQLFVRIFRVILKIAQARLQFGIPGFVTYYVHHMQVWALNLFLLLKF